ncbi:MAG: heme exporter protein CcmB [Rhodospirillales bacterium]
MSRLILILRRDLRQALRQGTDSMTVVIFFVIAVALFPFGVGPELDILARIGGGVIWVAALLAAMLSLERLFQADFEDGSLELLSLEPVALETMVLAKVLGHWLTTGVPLVIASPFLAMMMNMHADGYAPLLLALALGTPTLSLIGAVGAALILGARRGGVLLSLLVLPLYIPVLIFGVAAVDAAISSFPTHSYLMILAAILLASLPLCPWAAAAALRHSME